jgi:hypothetical protein
MSQKAYTSRQQVGGHNGDSSAKIVFSSIHYSTFVLDPKNRPVDQDKLMRLYDAIAAKNLLSDNPILIDRGRVVVDGQHRLKVAEALKVPIYYIIADTATIIDVPGLASRRSPWTMLDYLHHWCVEGLPDYLQLREFMNRNDFLPPVSTISLCYYGTNLNLRQKFNEGQYECNDEEFAQRVVGALLDFRDIGFKKWRDKIFIDTMSNLLSNADYDHKRMMSKLAFNPSAMRPAVSMDDYIEIINAIYNYKVRSDNHLVLRRLSSGHKKYRIDRSG